MERNTRSNGMQNSAFIRDIRRAFAEEMRTVTDYLYGAMIVAKISPPMAKLLDEIARVEMSHYEQLGQLLLWLGNDPAQDMRFMQSPKRKQASLTPEQLLHESMANEQNAAMEYRRLAAIAPTANVAALLKEIAAEEEGHAVALDGMRVRLGRA